MFLSPKINLFLELMHFIQIIVLSPKIDSYNLYILYKLYAIKTFTQTYFLTIGC